MKLSDILDVIDDKIIIYEIRNGIDKKIFDGQPFDYSGDDFNREIDSIWSEIVYPTGSYSSDDFYSKTVIKLKSEE